MLSYFVLHCEQEAEWSFVDLKGPLEFISGVQGKQSAGPTSVRWSLGERLTFGSYIMSIACLQSQLGPSLKFV